MSLAEYEEFVYGAGLLDADDPVAEWEAVRRADRARRRRSSRASAELRVVADGTDLTLGVAGRHWIPAQGRENFPDGEIFTAPIEDRVDGHDPLHVPGGLPGPRGARRAAPVRGRRGRRGDGRARRRTSSSR